MRERAISRRGFLEKGSGLLAGTAVLSGKSFALNQESLQVMKDELSPEELKWVNQSLMSKNLKNYFGEGYSCAESLLMVSLEYLGRSKEILWTAAGFGGGMLHGDLCGFLTGGVMAIGVWGGTLSLQRNEAKERVAHNVEEFWKWWKSIAPFRCKEIQSQGSNPQRCFRLGRLAAAKIHDLILMT